MPERSLVTSQCPFCFYRAPLPGFSGFCPQCGKDSSKLIRYIRYNDPETLDEEEAAAAYRLQRIHAGLEEPPV